MAATMIGGAFLSATVQAIVGKLASTEFLNYITNTRLNVSLLRQLRTILLTLHVVLDDAEEKQINNPAVKQWLDDLKDAVFDAEDLLNQISYDSLRCKMENTQAGNRTNQVRNFLSSPFKNFYGEINSQIKIMCETLQLFAQHKDILGLQTKSGKISRRTFSSSVVSESVMVGRKDDEKAIMNMLLSKRDPTHNNIGVVAILGMGGLGKTTLAQLLYNNKEVQQYFDLKAWACVSEDYDIMRVTKSLLESVTSRTCESNNLDFLRVELKKNLRENRFLLVLDDLWNNNYNDWDELVSPFIDGKPGSMVIITTRQQKVAEMAQTFPIYKLEPLSDNDCWSLLSKHALGNDGFRDSKNTGFEAIGWKIARKCGGLPIAAKTLGDLLRSKVNTREWTEILNSNAWDLPNDNIMPALHLSYQYLPSHLKRCFAYCSIFPKGYSLNRKKLVWLWMAEGFLDFSKGGKSIEEVGDDCFAELLSRSLIQQDARTKWFFMHDLVNDLATAISGRSCCRLECGDISEKVRHLSYIQEQYDISMRFKYFSDSKYLRSFLPIYTKVSVNYLSIKVVDDLLPTLKRLRVLSLSKYSCITKLPDSIGNLVQLRYLDLSYTKIKSLPDTVCNLYNLQTLILLNCECLTELPMHIGNLINLHHLDLSGTNINELPVGIGGLENLQTLTLFIVGKQHVGLSIKELGKFQNIQGTLTIKNLHNVVDAREAEGANLKSKEKIEKLELLWGEKSEDSLKVKLVLEMLQPPINLERLHIDLYGGTSFPSWLGNSSFSNMVCLHINSCEYCMTLPPLGQLPSLKQLCISSLLLLETIGPEFYCVQEGEGSNSSFQPFPSLEIMKFHTMPNLKEWLPFEGIKFAFPRLRRMELYNCPELRGHFPSHLSCMEGIEIKGCDHLLKTPQTLHWLSSIKKVNLKDLDSKGRAQRTQRSPLESDSLCLLERVSVESHPMSMLKMILSSTCLQHLNLSNIPSLTAFPTNGLPTSLQSLRIRNCKNLSFMPPEIWSNYTSLVSLELWNSCDELTSFPLDGFPALHTLEIGGCSSLDSIFILENPLRRQSSLRSFIMKTHDSTQSLRVNLRMDSLTNLEHLYLFGLKFSFCEGVCLPPNLKTITIHSQRKFPPVSEWGLQDLTALSRLTIRMDNDMFNTLMKQLLLPISLVSLTIHDLYKMKSFDGNGLRQLSHLENLEFLRCEQLESLPENWLPSSLKSLKFSKCIRLESLSEESLPDSLRKLAIKNCPLLREKYKRKEHWSKICHIPFIQIDSQVTI